MSITNPKAIKAGKKIKIKIKIKNLSNALNLENAKLVVKVSGPGNYTYLFNKAFKSSIKSLGSENASLSLKLKKPGKYKFKFKASASNATSKSASKTVAVKKKK